jgi:predicted RNA-binding protein with PUA-like domain
VLRLDRSLVRLALPHDLTTKSYVEAIMKQQGKVKSVAQSSGRASNVARYWLFKTEPSEFSIDDLRAAPKQTTCWDGVRNYQARNLLRDEIQVGDRVLVYHSSTDPNAVVGVARVVRAGYPDHTARDPADPHYDEKASAADPRWFMVDIQLDTVFTRPVTLAELRGVPALKDMELLRRGSRLSVQPVRPDEFQQVLKLAGEARQRSK